jgi:hypothetical protein
MQLVTRCRRRWLAAWSRLATRSPRLRLDDRGDISSDTAMMVLMLGAAVAVGTAVTAIVTGAAESLGDLMPGG